MKSPDGDYKALPKFQLVKFELMDHAKKKKRKEKWPKKAYKLVSSSNLAQKVNWHLVGSLKLFIHLKVMSVVQRSWIREYDIAEKKMTMTVFDKIKYRETWKKLKYFKWSSWFFFFYSGISSSQSCAWREGRWGKWWLECELELLSAHICKWKHIPAPWKKKYSAPVELVHQEDEKIA